MYQAILTINGEQFYGIGQTRRQAVNAVTALISRTHTAGFALVTRPATRTRPV
jgi:hypothetical protein